METTMIKIKTDFDKVKFKYNSDSKAVKKATTSAVNAMAYQAKAKSSKVIRENYNMKAADVNKTLSIRKATPSRQIAKVLSIGYKALSLGKFKPRQTKKGVSVAIEKGSKRSTIKHAFKATMASGHKGVFLREGPKREMKKGRYAGKKRQPIEDQFTAGVPILFEAKKVRPKVLAFIAAKWPSIISSKIDFFTKRGIK